MAKGSDSKNIQSKVHAADQRIAVLSVHYARADGFVQLGGAEKYARGVVTGLLAAGARVHAAYSGDDIYSIVANDASERLAVEKTDWLNDALSGDGRLSPGVILNRTRWLRTRRITTIVAIQQNGGGSFAASLVAGRLLGLRVISAIRQEPIAIPAATGKRWLGLIPSPELWRRRLIWRRRLAQACCDRLIFNSRAVADAHHSLFNHNRRRERIIPNAEYAASLRDVHRVQSVASVGRITEAKGADLLLEAFGRIAGRHPAATLTYFGDGPLVPMLRDRAGAMGLAKRVRFPGYAADRDAIYSNVDILVQPSRREAMSNSVVEAMARGIPCVVSDVGGLPETVDRGGCGVVFASGQPDACASAISRLLEHPDEANRLGRAAHVKARTTYDAGAIEAATVEAILG